MEVRSPLDINGRTHSDGFVEPLEQQTDISISHHSCQTLVSFSKYCNFRKYAHPLHVKEGIITEKVFPVFSESFFGLVLAWSCTFGS